MAKRRKRKHRPSAKYITFAQRKNQQSIIPTITKTAKTSKVETKLIRDSIRKAFSEQQKVTTPKPSTTYTSNKKKNRKEARQRRKEKKQKAKQLQQQRQIQQEEPKIEIPTLDYGERDEEFRSTETPVEDDTTNYIEDLIAMIHTVEESVAETFGKWYQAVDNMTAELNKIEYWLEEALQLPYEQKRVLCDTLEGNQFLTELENIMHFQYYKDVEETIDAVGTQIIAIIESVY